MKTITITLIALLISISGINAQNNELETSTNKEKRAFQFSFIYPMGTNGVNSTNYSNYFSLNLLGGFNGGVDACEIGAFANINQGNVYGFQAAGFTNVNIGNSTSFQFAGFYNQNNKFNGMQFAGFLNTNIGNTAGLMAAGFANLSRGTMQGWQVAGFINTNVGETHAAQFAGFTNVVSNNMIGAQIAGFSNIAKDINGVQLAGIMNVAGKVKGVQLALINIADSVDGVSIGLLNFIKNGYNRIEFGSNESLYGNVTFKLGADRFYNIFTSGLKVTGSDLYWSFGYGIGTVFNLQPKVSLNLDLISQQIVENTWEMEKVNLLNTGRINLSYKFAKHLEIAAGPSFNVFISEFDHNEGIGSKSDFISSYCFYDQVYDQYSIKMYVGFNAAIRF